MPTGWHRPRVRTPVERDPGSWFQAVLHHISAHFRRIFGVYAVRVLLFFTKFRIKLTCPVSPRPDAQRGVRHRHESVVHKRSVAGVGRRYAVICRRVCVCVCVCDGQCGQAGPAAPASCRASAHSLTRSLAAAAAAAAAACIGVASYAAAAHVLAPPSRLPTVYFFLPHLGAYGWPSSRLVSVLDSGAEGPGFKSQPRRCHVTVIGKLITPIVPLFTKQRNW